MTENLTIGLQRNQISTTLMTCFICSADGVRTPVASLGARLRPQGWYHQANPPNNIP